MNAFSSHCASRVLAAASLWLTILHAGVAGAGIGDSPLPHFSDNTSSVTVMQVTGLVNRDGTATVFLCTNVGSVSAHIGVEVFDDANNTQNDVHAGAGAVLGVGAGATVTISTSATAAFLETEVMTVSPTFGQGSARVVASNANVRCNAVLVEDGVTPPLSMSTISAGTKLVAGTFPASQPLPTFSDGKPATASALFPGAVKRGTLETAVICTSLASTNVDIGVEVRASDGSPGNLVSSGNGAVLNVGPGRTVTLGTTGTAALLETSVIALPSIAQGVARVVSTSADVLCSAMSLDSAFAPPSAMTELSGHTSASATAGMLPRATPLFPDQSPSVAVATVPGIVKRGTLQTLFLCSSRSSSTMQIGVQVFDRLGLLQNDVTAGVGVVTAVAPGATVTIATSGTAAYLEDAVIPLADGLQGVARILASSDEVSCTSVVVDDAATPPASIVTLAGVVRPYQGALPASAPLPTFSNGNPATHVAVFPGLTKRSDVETDIVCTSIASAPIDVGVEVFSPAGGVANIIADDNGALLGVAPGETVFYGTTGSAAFFENQVVVLAGVAQGMARVVSNSGDLLCSALVFDQSVTPPSSMTGLAGYAGSCGDGILQPGEQCDGSGLDAACPGNCSSDCLCPAVCGDGFMQAGEECDDANLANGDCCSSSCQLECDDGSPCTQDSCAAGVCTFEATPFASCREAGSSSFQVKVNASPDKNQMKWKWSSGPAVGYGEIGDPSSSSAYSICVFDSISGVPSAGMSLALPPSPLWTTRFPTSWAYKDKSATADGVASLKIAAGEAGRAKVGLKAAGSALPIATPASASLFFEQQPNVLVQMRNDETLACWQSTFTAFTTNDGARFKAKAP